MNANEVTEKLVAIHRDYQKDGGYDDAAGVRATTCPLTDLAGFDSDFIPEIVRRLAKDLGMEFPAGTRVKNIYVSDDGERKLTIAEIGRRFLQKYAPKDKGVAV
jgi:hypothetical protein